MNKTLVASLISLSLLAGCGGSDDPFVEEMTKRMASKANGVVDESALETCIEAQSDILTDEEKETVLAMLNNPDGNQNFSDIAKAQEAMQTTMAFSKDVFSCAMSNK